MAKWKYETRGIFVADDIADQMKAATVQASDVLKKWKMDEGIVIAYKMNPDAVVDENNMLVARRYFNISPWRLRELAEMFIREAAEIEAGGGT